MSNTPNTPNTQNTQNMQNTQNTQNTQNINQLQNECVSQYQERENKKLYDRNLPSQFLQPYLDFRPMATKYAYFPIVQPSKVATVQLNQQPTYNVHSVFNPGNTQSPWSGFATNINMESELRNQIYALQKCNQKEYVPTSRSDLYNYTMQVQTQPITHELLFQNENFQAFNPNPDKTVVGKNLFMNSTRSQLKNINSASC
jgi:hypothetical protein